MRTKIKLDPSENSVEESMSKYVPVSAKRRAEIEQVLERTRKTRNINIRISEHDLSRLRSRAEEEGIPYQTLISSVLHKYVSERLVEEEAILKSIELLRSNR